MPFAPVNGIDLYYETHGEGPTVVFAHGAGGNHASWWQQVPDIGRHYRCVTFDHRAFGRSHDLPEGPGRKAFADDLIALVDHLGIDRFFLVAQSMGGRTAAGAILRHPDRLRGAVLAGTTAGAVDDESRALKWGGRGPGGNGEFSLRALSPSFAEANPRMAYLYRQILRLNPPRPPDFLPPPPPDYRGSTAEGLAASGVPILFVAGKHDVIVPEPAMRRAHELVRGSRYAMHPESGHSVYFEQPDFFNRAVLDFFAEVEDARTISDR